MNVSRVITSVERDAASRCYEVNLYTEDESRYCQVFFHDDGRIEFVSQEQLASTMPPQGPEKPVTALEG